jgi:hypothetical protein
MKVVYGQPPRAKPRRCFGNGYFYAASGNLSLKFRTGEIYLMPTAGVTLWNDLKTAVQHGEFYNFNVRHVFHPGGKTIKTHTIPSGFTDSF